MTVGAHLAVRVQRVYNRTAPGPDEVRILVDRLWPRGIARAGAALDEWCKDVAPSTELRRWYGHEVVRFEGFARRYRAELRRLPASAAVEGLLGLGRTRTLVLLTATRDVDHSGARVLRDHLLAQRRRAA